MKYTIIFILVLYTFISCNTKEKLSNNDLIKENLKGDVVLVETQETSKDYTDHFTATFFNNLGMKELFFISSKTSLSKLLRKDEIKYVNNKIVESINKWYTIDGDNKIYSDNYSIKFKYDKDGRFSIKETIYNNAVVTINYIYDINNNIIEENLKHSDKPIYKSLSNIKYFYSNGILDSTVEIYSTVDRERDKNLSKVIYNNSKISIEESFINNLIYSRNEYFYDDNGDKIKEIETDENLKKKIISYKYEYDPKGNWVEQSKIADGVSDEIIKRTIIYKGESVDKFVEKYNNIEALFLEKNISNRGNNNQSNINQNSKCNKCLGTGLISCKDCAGRGETKCRRCLGSRIDYGRTCVECHGSGTQQCTQCYGRGQVECRTCHGSGKL